MKKVILLVLFCSMMAVADNPAGTYISNLPLFTQSSESGYNSSFPLSDIGVNDSFPFTNFTTGITGQVRFGDLFMSPPFLNPTFGNGQSNTGVVTAVSPGYFVGTLHGTFTGSLTGDITSNGMVTSYGNPVPVNKGGTNNTSIGSAGQALISNGTNNFAPGAVNMSGGSGVVSGVLPLANGGTGQLSIDEFSWMRNVGFSVTQSSNNLVLALKQADGVSDPSSASPATISFRSTSPANGGYNTVQYSSAFQKTIPGTCQIQFPDGIFYVTVIRQEQ